MKSTHSRDGKQVPGLDVLIAEITTYARGNDEQLCAFLQAIQVGVDVPSDAFVIDKEQR